MLQLVQQASEQPSLGNSELLTPSRRLNGQLAARLQSAKQHADVPTSVSLAALQQVSSHCHMTSRARLHTALSQSTSWYQSHTHWHAQWVEMLTNQIALTTAQLCGHCFGLVLASALNKACVQIWAGTNCNIRQHKVFRCDKNMFLCAVCSGEAAIKASLAVTVWSHIYRCTHKHAHTHSQGASLPWQSVHPIMARLGEACHYGDRQQGHQGIVGYLSPPTYRQPAIADRWRRGFICLSSSRSLPTPSLPFSFYSTMFCPAASLVSFPPFYMVGAQINFIYQECISIMDAQ